jgi:hypothetical protein
VGGVTLDPRGNQIVKYVLYHVVIDANGLID